jgi:glutamate synthase domain-containing protein 3
MFVRGVAGERFCVRNSGAVTVVEGVGDHGCEYMTGGIAVILGETGRNFAAGMSGGVAYVLDKGGCFAERCNHAMVALTEPDADDRKQLRALLKKHLAYTGSDAAKKLLKDFPGSAASFVKVQPKDAPRATVGSLACTGRGASR